MKRRLYLFTKVTLILTSTLFLGCGGKDSSEEGKNTSSKGTIGVSVLTLGNPFFSVIAENIKSEAAKNGYDVIVVDGNRNVQKQANQIDDFLTKGVAAIVLNPCDRISTGAAIKKANDLARRKLIQIPLREGRTIHHDVKAKDGSGRIVLRAASKGTGIIAGGPVRAVCEVLGVKDIVAKSMGTSNAHNVIRATMKALSKQNSPKQISAIRNKKISEIVEKRG